MQGKGAFLAERTMKCQVLLLLWIFSLSCLRAKEKCGLRFDKHDWTAIKHGTLNSGESNLWPDATVPFQWSPTLNITQKKRIELAMRMIEQASCLKFRQRINQKNYVTFQKMSEGCYTTGLGFNANRERVTVNLDRGCFTRTIILRQIFHALGFLHEFNRPDRDEYVEIKWKNIRNSTCAHSNFARAKSVYETINSCDFASLDPYDKCTSGVTAATFNMKYDWKSIMHCGRKPFTSNGRLTIQPRQNVIGLGNRRGMTRRDKQKLKFAYCCNNQRAYCKYLTGFCRIKYIQYICSETCNTCNQQF